MNVIYVLDLRCTRKKLETTAVRPVIFAVLLSSIWIGPSQLEKNIKKLWWTNQKRSTFLLLIAKGYSATKNDHKGTFLCEQTSSFQ